MLEALSGASTKRAFSAMVYKMGAKFQQFATERFTNAWAWLAISMRRLVASLGFGWTLAVFCNRSLLECAGKRCRHA